MGTCEGAGRWGKDGPRKREGFLGKGFCAPGGGGYLPERAASGQKNEEILDKVKEVTHTDMETILKNQGREPVKGALPGAGPRGFFADRKCAKIAGAVKEVLAYCLQKGRE